MALLPRAPRLDLLGRDSAEQVRRREVSRVLEKMDLSLEEEEAIERLSCALVTKLLLGPISEVMARAEVRVSHRGR
jgi:glutamyl-tRNA reductase